MIRDGSIRIPFRYAAGDTGSRFLRALQEGRIVASRCSTCERVHCPPASFCPECGASTASVDVASSGTLSSWTEVPGRGAYGLVILDGADTAMLHRLLGTGWTIGARVRARFASDPSASVLAIEGFEALKEDER